MGEEVGHCLRDSFLLPHHIQTRREIDPPCAETKGCEGDTCSSPAKTVSVERIHWHEQLSLGLRFKLQNVRGKRIPSILINTSSGSQARHWKKQWEVASRPCRVELKLVGEQRKRGFLYDIQLGACQTTMRLGQGSLGG